VYRCLFIILFIFQSLLFALTDILAISNLLHSHIISLPQLRL
jgi:hypothetical protein